ncbi:glycine zipper 2TM domain-containing protein [Imbroritus primus]|uniref:glycine zipper 2TM domain-containing protein n=1 Tax=Imbroritus primus TaxID=3058603 RepID=UPI000269A155
MKLSQRQLVRLVAAGAVLATLAGGAQAADRKTTNTLIGAAIGAVGGALISNGDPIMTIGGAAAGGLIGNVATRDRHDYGYRTDYRGDYRHGDRRVDYRRDPHPGYRGDYRDDYRNYRAQPDRDRAWQRDERVWQRDNRVWQDGGRGYPRQVTYGRPGDDRYYDGRW